MPVHVVYNHFPEIAARLKPLAREVEDRTAERVKDEAELLAPKLTGELAASGEVKRTDEGVEVEFTARNVSGDEYGLYQEFGTSKMPAQPFVRPAMDIEQPRFEHELAAGIVDF